MAPLVFALLSVVLVTGESQNSAPENLFPTTIRPALVENCLKCHGGSKVRGGLRLETRDGLLKGGEHGPAIVPGDADKSMLLQALRHAHEEIKMPPTKKLPEALVADFAAWIKAGAPWPKEIVLKPAQEPKKHWAFEPVKKISPPRDTSGWSEQPVDRFIRARQKEHALQPAAPADRRALIRRASFDLVGLPPTPEEVEAFVADASPDAWAKVVDRLLASPRYGERWARHWLDVVRYADTGGFEADLVYANAWRYRDTVIRALNADKPFDRFLEEQVAGDELWPGDKEAVQATALYAIGPTLPEAALVPNQLDYEWLTDVVDITGAAFLGLSLGCARCHDHKYDPITQKDYFSMQAIFAPSDRPYSSNVRTLQIKALNGLLSEAPLPKELEKDPRCLLRTESQTGLRLFHRDEPLTVHRLHRGDLGKDREALEADVPAILAGPKAGLEISKAPAGGRRAALARWLTSPENPLTARVLVNRVWGWHFGEPLVRTPNDFGGQGEPPTHPDLLDWLAGDFVEHHWSLKHLHRRMMLSKTYQMTSLAQGPALRIDPENRLLWHYPRRRLEGEIIRDSILACAGNLNLQEFGPPVVPPLGKDELTGLFSAGSKWPATKDPAEHTRRSVYMLVRRTFVYPMFAAFDPPEVMTSCARRFQTVVPTQALTLLNSPFVRKEAGIFAERLFHDCDGAPEKCLARVWQQVFARPITESERMRAVAFLKARQETLARSSAGPEIPRRALAELCLSLFNANEFIYID